MKHFNEFTAHIQRLYTKVMNNKIQNVMEFMSLSLRLLSLRISFEKNIFCMHNLQTRTICTFSIYKYTLRELLIMSANFLTLYCASILDLLWWH